MSAALLVTLSLGDVEAVSICSVDGGMGLLDVGACGIASEIGLLTAADVSLESVEQITSTFEDFVSEVGGLSHKFGAETVSTFKLGELMLET